LKAAPPVDVKLPRSWPVVIVTIGSEPAAFAGACPKHRTQASMPKTLMGFMFFLSYY
jgi:hypothetical protein